MMYRNTSGFTLIELLITVASGVILATVAVPSFSNYIDNQRVRAGAQDLYVGFQFARSEAIKRNDDVTIQAASGGWSDGWTVKDASDNTLREHEGLSGLTMSSSPTTSVTFNGDGRVDGCSPNPFRLCDEATSSTTKRRMVEIGVSGRPRLELDGSCS